MSTNQEKKGRSLQVEKREVYVKMTHPRDKAIHKQLFEKRCSFEMHQLLSLLK